MAEMMEISTCGWVLSVLRSPYKSGVFPADVTKSRLNYSLETSCKYLESVGLDTMLGDLLYLTKQSSVQEVLNALALPNFASMTRARGQLTYMMDKFEMYLNQSTVNQLCVSNGNYLLSKCSLT